MLLLPARRIVAPRLASKADRPALQPGWDDLPIDRPRPRAGWWRRFLAGAAGNTRLQPGTCCGCGSTVCVVQCGTIPVYGAVVTVLSGTTIIATCTTDTGGCCSLPVSGTYTLRITVGGTVDYNATRTLSGTVVVPISDANTVCCGGYAVPKNMTLTDATDTYSMTFQGPSGGTGPFTWTLQYWITRSSVPILPPPPIGSCHVGTASDGPIIIFYTLTCNGASVPRFALRRTWVSIYETTGGGGAHTPYSWAQNISGCPSVSGCNSLIGTQCQYATDSEDPTSAVPFAISFNPIVDPANITPDPVGGSVTMSA